MPAFSVGGSFEDRLTAYIDEDAAVDAPPEVAVRVTVEG